MRLFVLSLLTAALPGRLAAAELPMRDYVHTVWTQHDGAPFGIVRDIFQTGDGYLWLLTRWQGLLRFDGMRFVRPSTPCTKPITAASASPDGGFWAMCGNQLLRRTAQGAFLLVPQTFLPAAPPFGIHVDRTGRPWFFGAPIRYLEPDGTGGRQFSSPTTSPIIASSLDDDDTAWVSDGAQVFHIYPDHTVAVGLNGVYGLEAARGGGAFATTSAGVWRLRSGSRPSEVGSAPAGVTLSNINHSLAEAADGVLWIGTRQHGVVRLLAGRIETAAENQDDRFANSVFVDREETIWVGGTSGLQRFRKPLFHAMSSASRDLTGIPSFVFVDSRDDIWIAPTGRHGVMRISPNGNRAAFAASDLVSAIGEDREGRIWLSDTHDIGYLANGQFVPVHDEMNARIPDVWSFQQDRQGQFWALAVGRGVYRVTHGAPRLEVEAPEARHRFLVSERWGTWIAINGVERHMADRTEVFAAGSSSPRDVAPNAIVEDGDSIWVGTRDLKRWRHGTWTIWTTAHGLPTSGSVEGIVPDSSGHLWLLTAGGLLMVPRAQLDATPDGAPRALSFAQIGVMDGLVSQGGGSRASPRISADRRGRLYLTTNDTVGFVDPPEVTGSALAPPIVLESVTIDNRAVDLGETRPFVEPSRLQFDYTSLSLRSPENARFRYRLEGYDPDWIDAGGERRVTYGTLAPGQYRFRVIGASGEGVWNEQGASFAFQVAPVFWRTLWFRATVLVMGLSIAAGVYRLRMQQLRHEFTRNLEVRVSERMRIARELHDTLLQTFHGAVLRLHAAARSLPEDTDARKSLDGAIEHAAQAVSDGRKAVQGLRASTSETNELAPALHALGDELGFTDRSLGGAALQIHVEGTPRTLHPLQRDDIYRTAAEALRNAFLHAEATKIDVTIHYGERQFRVLVRDDGKGIDPAVRAGLRRAGHYGLPGMYERAALIGGAITVSSEPGSGTGVELTVPAAKAYAPSPAATT